MRMRRNETGERFRSLGTALLVGILPVWGASASPPEPPGPSDLEDNGTVRIYAAGDANQVDYRLDYPGLEVNVVDGQIFNNWSAPDCLVLVGPFWGPARQGELRELAGRLVVSDGRGILVGDDSEMNVIEPRLVDGTYVWFLKDLATYVTGIRVKVSNGESFDTVLRDVFGEDDATGVSLLLSRGCQVFGDQALKEANEPRNAED